MNDNFPVPPKPKMPTGRMVRMVSVALVFETLQTICSLLVVFAPVLVCYFAKYWVQTNVIDSETVGELACEAAGFSIAASYVVGVGVGIALLGWVLSMMVSCISYMVFFAWFKFAGANFMDRAGAKLWISGLGFILELMPFINVLPISTATAYFTARQLRKEDKEAQDKYEREVQAALAMEKARAEQEEQAVRARALQAQIQAQNPSVAANDNEGNVRLAT